jgi:death-on-curing protein
MDLIRLPDQETVEGLHDIVLGVSGGKPGIHDINLVIAAVQRPQTYIQYDDEYDLDTICALLIDSIARNHGFKDGNKRTALLTAVFTYRINGVDFKATPKMNEDFDDLIMWVVLRKPPVDEIRIKLQQQRAKHEGAQESWINMLTAFVTAKFKRPDEK